MDCKVIDGGRRCLRWATMRLPYIFMFLLLFSAGGLLLLLHLQYLTETLHEQAPGGKLIFPQQRPDQCPYCLDNNTHTSSPKGRKKLSRVRPVKLWTQRSPVAHPKGIAPQITKNYRKLLLKNSALLLQLNSTPAGQASNHIQRLTQIQQSRRKLMRDVCAKYRSLTRTISRRQVSRIYVEDTHKLLYCEVPKAGCSNWKRVLMVLQGQASSTRELRHEQVHYANHLKRLDSFDHKQIAHRLNTYTKVLFLREPFERLVSAFRDKFESPNSYYHPVFGKPIIAKYRANASRSALLTGEGVTFKEFIQYLLDVRRPVGMDIHWERVVQLCSPCLINYDFIGKFETIEEEANFLLRHIGAPANLTFPSFKDRNPNAARTSSRITQEYFSQLSLNQRQKTYDFFYMDYLMFNYSKPFSDLH
ncbi:carbohydrate sulfotransferase 8 [Ictalurus furcatus]|uniref:carbohydrate sulfotransferase 8 n=1 Tax=Ictalurus furcatus TaxID=66913 RepID=UPI002350BA52|nr:carbohydrate sulfotransferase 8 [Ictalurus furcatus]